MAQGQEDHCDWAMIGYLVVERRELIHGGNLSRRAENCMEMITPTTRKRVEGIYLRGRGWTVEGIYSGGRMDEDFHTGGIFTL